MASKWPRDNNRTKGRIRRQKGSEGSQAPCISGVRFQVQHWQLWEEVYWSPKQGISSPIVVHLSWKNYYPVTKPACNSYGSRLTSEPHSFRELGARHLVCPPWLSVPARGGPPLVDSVSLHLSELAEVSPDLVSSPRLNLPVTAWEVMLAIVR